MTKSSRLVRAIGTAATTTALAVGVAVAVPTAAQADPVNHYYIEIGGTGATPPAPHCTFSYDEGNKVLPPGSAAVPVCYPATAGPVLGPGGALVDLQTLQVHPDALTAPNFDSSAQQGYQNALKAAEDTYHAHPDARLTITGYSQGAQIGDEVLQTIAGGGTDIPRSRVDGMLYADPMQPGTGLGGILPKGVTVPVAGITSPGAGPAHFQGIPVERFCIHGDPICEAAIQNAPGYVSLHPLYPNAGNVIAQTIAQDGGDGIHWRKPDGSPA
jgi:hypothetical protein